MSARDIARAAEDAVALVDTLGGTVDSDTRDAIDSAVSYSRVADDWQAPTVDVAELIYAELVLLDVQADPGAIPAITAAVVNDLLRTRYLDDVRAVTAKHMADAVRDNATGLAAALDTAYQSAVVTPLLAAVASLGHDNVLAVARSQLTGQGPNFFDDPALDDVQDAYAAHHRILTAYQTALDRAGIATDSDDLFLWADPGDAVTLAAARDTHRLPILAADIGMTLALTTPADAAARQAQAIANGNAP